MFPPPCSALEAATASGLREAARVIKVLRGDGELAVGDELPIVALVSAAMLEMDSLEPMEEEEEGEGRKAHKAVGSKAGKRVGGGAGT